MFAHLFEFTIIFAIPWVDFYLFFLFRHRRFLRSLPPSVRQSWQRPEIWMAVETAIVAQCEHLEYLFVFKLFFLSRVKRFSPSSSSSSFSLSFIVPTSSLFAVQLMLLCQNASCSILCVDSGSALLQFAFHSHSPRPIRKSSSSSVHFVHNVTFTCLLPGDHTRCAECRQPNRCDGV